MIDQERGKRETPRGRKTINNESMIKLKESRPRKRGFEGKTESEWTIDQGVFQTFVPLDRTTTFFFFFFGLHSLPLPLSFGRTCLSRTEASERSRESVPREPLPQWQRLWAMRAQFQTQRRETTADRCSSIRNGANISRSYWASRYPRRWVSERCTSSCT